MEGAGGSTAMLRGLELLGLRDAARHTRVTGNMAEAFWGEVSPAIGVGCLVTSLPVCGAERVLLPGITRHQNC